MAYKLERPDVDTAGKQAECLRDGELCTVGSQHFILANVELPYNEDAKFVWTCWVSLSDESY
jgi:hypothetical protein